jgi:hypothetical protein
MHLFVNKMADPDISDYECDADDLLLMSIIIPQFDLQAEFPDLDSEDSRIYLGQPFCLQTSAFGVGI